MGNSVGNLPILYINIMHGLPTQLGKDAFLWAAERPGNDRMCYAAEKFAHEVEALVAVTLPMLDIAFRIHANQAAEKGRDFPADIAPVRDDLMNFLLTRHANWRMGGNVNPTYCEAA